MMRRTDKRTILGITLSKRGWNNVLVYVVLLIMALLWFSAPGPDRVKTPTADPEVLTLLPENSSLDSIVIDDQVVEKAANGWRCQSPCALSQQQAASMANVWLNLNIEPADIQPSEKLVDVYLNFSDNQHARVELYLKPRLLLRLPQQDKVFQPVDATIEQLLGR